jgi:hypothetical protein
MRLFTIAVAIAAAALVAGCDQHPSKTVKIRGKDGNVTITSNGEHATIKANDGKTTLEINTNSLGSQKLPDFAPVFPGAQVKGSVTVPTEGGGTVAFETSAAPDKVIAFYKDRAKSAGLAEKLSMVSDSGATYVAGTDDGKKMLQVVVAKKDASSQVQISWAAK